MQEAARTAGTFRRFIHVSTDQVYGPSPPDGQVGEQCFYPLPREICSKFFLRTLQPLLPTRTSLIVCSPSLGHSVLLFGSSQNGVCRLTLTAEPPSLVKFICWPCSAATRRAGGCSRATRMRRPKPPRRCWSWPTAQPTTCPLSSSGAGPANNPSTAGCGPAALLFFFALFAISLSSLLAPKHWFGPPVLSRTANFDFSGYSVCREPLPSLICSNVYGPRQYPEKVRLSVTRPCIARGCRQHCVTRTLRALHSGLEPCWYRTC